MIRKIITKLNENDYHIFARIANDSGLSVQEKIQEIVDIYIIIEKKKINILLLVGSLKKIKLVYFVI